MSIFHQGIDRWKMILFLNHNYINRTKNLYHIDFNNECFSLNIWFIQETILSFRCFILPINGITIKKYLGMFSVEMRAILINVFAAINYHSAKNLHFPIKICLTINAILTEIIHNNHFMGRRKLEQQNKVNYPVCKRYVVKLYLFTFSLSHILPKNPIV